MTMTPAKNSTGKHTPEWHRFLQFSLRSLLIVITLAAVGCWWYLRPEMRQEQLGQSSLRLRREIRQTQMESLDAPVSETAEVWSVKSNWFAVENVGRWQLFDHGGDLLVNGRYRNGKQHGKWTTYHVNGRKAAEGMMRDGKKVGLWRTWDEDGTVLEEATFE